MQRLDGCDNAKLLEPRDIQRAHNLKVFDPVAAIPDAIDMLRRLETVQCLTDGRIANGMNVNLKLFMICRCKQIFQALGFPEEMFTVLFAIPRTVGWLAHMVELLDDKEQKISRPRQWYTGQDVRSYTELQKR